RIAEHTLQEERKAQAERERQQSEQSVQAAAPAPQPVATAPASQTPTSAPYPVPEEHIQTGAEVRTLETALVAWKNGHGIKPQAYNALVSILVEHGAMRRVA
ncbi:MAG: hypothetical protein ACRETC_12150, partial [Gammaproteobacteria bacterium]